MYSQNIRKVQNRTSNHKKKNAVVIARIKRIHKGILLI